MATEPQTGQSQWAKVSQGLMEKVRIEVSGRGDFYHLDYVGLFFLKSVKVKPKQGIYLWVYLFVFDRASG